MGEDIKVNPGPKNTSASSLPASQAETFPQVLLCLENLAPMAKLQTIETRVAVAAKKLANLSSRLASLAQEWASFSSIPKDVDAIPSESTATAKKLA